MIDLRVAVALSLLLLSGCVSGPKFSEREASIAPPAPSCGRVFFYYTSSNNPHPPFSTFHPYISVDGHKVGEFMLGTVSFVDLPAGVHQVESGGITLGGVWIDYTKMKEGESMHLSIAVPVAAGQSRYLEFCDYVSTDCLANGKLTLVHPDQASQDIRGLVYRGQ